MKIRRIAILLLALASVAFGAQDRDGDRYITILVPISAETPAPGAFGTSWVTELWGHNETAVPVPMTLCLGGIVFGPPPNPCTPPTLPPQTSKILLNPGLERTGPFHPLMFRLALEDADHLSFTSRLFETTRMTQPVGVDLPVVREEQLLDRPARFIAIPGNTTSRVSLRIYDVPYTDVAPDHPVRVELTAIDGSPLGKTTLVPMYTGGPKLAQITDLATVFPQLTTAGHFDIVVTPETNALYWALVSVTDNDTQQVFLVTPK